MRGAKLPMTSNSIRSFAGGLIVAASMCGIAYFSGPTETAQTAEKPSTEEMKSMLASEGYVIHTEDRVAGTACCC